MSHCRPNSSPRGQSAHTLGPSHGRFLQRTLIQTPPPASGGPSPGAVRTTLQPLGGSLHPPQLLLAGALRRNMFEQLLDEQTPMQHCMVTHGPNPHRPSNACRRHDTWGEDPFVARAVNESSSLRVSRLPRRARTTTTKMHLLEQCFRVGRRDCACNNLRRRARTTTANMKNIC